MHSSPHDRLVTNGRLVVGLLLAAVASAACGSSDLTAPAVNSCSTAALSGTYGMLRNGLAAAGTRLTTAGVATFDGKGNSSVEQTVSTNGTYSSVANQAASYVINSDCTGTERDAAGTPIATLVMVRGGDEVLGISLIPGSSMTVQYERIVGPCSATTLIGDYGFQRSGVNAAGLTIVSVGFISFDGKGVQRVIETTNRGGVIGATEPLTGAYTVNPDCTGAQIDPATGKAFSRIIVVQGGNTVIGMSKTPGNNVTETLQKIK